MEQIDGQDQEKKVNGTNNNFVYNQFFPILAHACCINGSQVTHAFEIIGQSWLPVMDHELVAHTLGIGVIIPSFGQ